MSSRSLDDLNPEIVPLVNDFLAASKDADIDLLVTCTLRSNEDQARLWAQGRTEPGKIVTNAQAGQSAHNYGLAIDVVPMVNGKPDWDGEHPIWQHVGSLGTAAGLEWAGSPGFPFHEMAHFQLPDWRKVLGI